MRQLSAHRFNFIAFLFSVFLFNTSACFAADGLDTELESYFRVIWGLLVVLGIILVLYGVLKKRFSLVSTSTTDAIKIVEVKPLMGKKALCLVEVKGQELLLGLSENSISHLATLRDNSEASFGDVLQNATKGGSR